MSGYPRPDFERIGFLLSAVLLYGVRNKGLWSRQLRCVNYEHVQDSSQNFKRSPTLANRSFCRNFVLSVNIEIVGCPKIDFLSYSFRRLHA